MLKVKVLDKKVDDSKKVDELLKLIEEIQQDVKKYQNRTQKLLDIKDTMIKIQEQRITLYKKDEVNSFLLFICTSIVLLVSLILNIMLI